MTQFTIAEGKEKIYFLYFLIFLCFNFIIIISYFGGTHGGVWSEKKLEMPVV